MTKKILTSWTNQLKNYCIASSSSSSGFKIAAKIIIASSKSLPIRERIIPKTADQVKIAIEGTCYKIGKKIKTQKVFEKKNREKKFVQFF